MAATTVREPSENSPLKRANRRCCERKKTSQNRVSATKRRNWEKTVEDAGLLAGQIRFLEAIYQAVEVEMMRGKTLVDLVQFDEGVPVAASLRLPPDLNEWVGHRFPGQVHMIYEEISQGKPHGDIVADD